MSQPERTEGTSAAPDVPAGATRRRAPKTGRAGGARRSRAASPPASEHGAEYRYLNREIARLDFSARVLALAEDPTLPVLERAKFLAIFSQNLDELFQVRVAALHERQLLGAPTLSPDGLSPSVQLARVREAAEILMERRSRIFRETLVPDLEAAGIRFSQWKDLDEEDRAHLDRVFETRIFPVLTPLAVDPAHPFPYISNLSLNLAVVVRQGPRVPPLMARVKVPPLLPRFVVLPDGERFVPVEQVIAAHLSSLFPGMQVLAHHTFRLTRQADFETDDGAADILVAVESVIRMRKRSPMVVRLEIEKGMSDWVRELLTRELEVDDSRVYTLKGPLDLTGLWALYGLPRPDLKMEPWTASIPPRLAPVSVTPGTPGATGQLPNVFSILRQGDVLVHHPYESFAASVEAFVDQAAADPDVLAIKQTLYRTSSTDSPIVRALIRAAESGKQAVALVELKARFDEEANIAWARVLEEAGVHVVYGVVGLKTHAKTSLVVRQEISGIRLYAHIGTGNYNSDTARLYEDLGLLTANPVLGADLSELFNYLTGYSQRREYRSLLVAPVTMRAEILRLIEGQSHPGGRITIKVNNLADPTIIDALYAASGAGCQIDLIVRSVCCLRPGAEGLSENIRVRSIVGRYLEHSRILRFGVAGGDSGGQAHYYIGSADLMIRNLDERVEALVPIADPILTARLDEVLEVNLADDELAWELGADGAWTKVPTTVGINAQHRLQEMAAVRGRGGAIKEVIALV
ncbi:MAG TPA: polyphosphate kinase 1 [Actinomycetota bacterium]|nr:polyphosphate kinase 1 [Actinomycetota bacterium]